MSFSFKGSNVIVPNTNRTRNLSSDYFMPHKGIANILKKSGPRLQVQFNDANNKCIGESWVLKPEVKISSRDSLFQTRFVPISDSLDNLRIPDNAESIVIFGQQAKFASIESALNKLTDRLKFKSEYVPTRGIEISGPIYLTTPTRLVLTGFRFENYDNLISPFNDIIKSFKIEDGVLKMVETIRF